MPNDINWDNEDGTENEDSSYQDDGNNAIKALRKLHDTDKSKISTLEQQLEGLLSKDRERTVKEVLEKKGVNPKATRLVLKDVTEVTEDNINAWLQDNAELFNLQMVPATVEDDTQTSDDSDELGKQDAVTSQAVSPGAGKNVKALIDSFKTFEELEAWSKTQK